MSEKLNEIQREVTSLRKYAEELQRLKSDCDQLRKLREKLVETGFD